MDSSSTHAPGARLDVQWLRDAVRRTLDEDLGGDPGRDVTTQATIAVDAVVLAHLVARAPGVLAGAAVIEEALAQVAERLAAEVPAVELRHADGDWLEAGAVIAVIRGSGPVVLIAERTILNLMSRACGVATHTRRWADQLAGTGAQVLDTRKTTPMLRELEKYAVRCGGGTNKRMGLYDVAMVKDNHIVATGSVADAVAAIRARFPEVPIQVEVESLAQAREAISAGARFLLLDNMTNDEMRELVTEVRAGEKETGRVELEATGGLTVERAAEVAATGVDYMSVGALTHSSPILDLALDLREDRLD